MSRDCWSKGKGKGRKGLWNVGDEETQEEETPEEPGQDEYNPDEIAAVTDALIRKICCSNRFKALEDKDEQTEDGDGEEQAENEGWNKWIKVSHGKKNQRARKRNAKEDEKKTKDNRDEIDKDRISCLEDYDQVVEDMMDEVTEGSNKQKGKWEKSKAP